MEPIYRKSIPIEDIHTDCFGRLKPAAMLYFVQEMAGSHVHAMALAPAPEEMGLIWVITRHRLQITRLPRKGETVCLETWPMPTTRVAYPRSVVAYDEHGGELFRSVSLWVLMDKTSRAMVLPGKSGVLVPGILRGNELPGPHGLVPAACAAYTTRRVCFSDMDANFHMNNCRYLDWIDDLLPAAFHETHDLQDMTLCYPNEAREGDELEIHRQSDADGVLRVDVQRRTADKKVHVFTCELHYATMCSVN